MAFPVVAARQTSTTPGLGSPITVTLPSGIAVGNLLVVIVGGFSSSATFPAGWTTILNAAGHSGSQSGLAVAYRIADGSEGASISVSYTDTTNQPGAIAYRITGHSPSQAPVVATIASASSGSPNPPGLTPAGGARDYLWIAAVGLQGGSIATTAPSGYSDLQRVDGGNGAALSAERQRNISTENPGVFSGGGGLDSWVSTTIAVYPTMDLSGAAQTVMSASGAMGLRMAMAGSAQSVLSGAAHLGFAGMGLSGGAQMVLSGSGVLSSDNVPDVVDFTKFDIYMGGIGLIAYEGEGARNSTETVELRPVKQDVGMSPDENRPETGDIFAQSDFSHGQGQLLFHAPGANKKKYLRAEGYDLSVPGKLTHLWRTAEAVDSVNIGTTVVAGDLPFVADGTNVLRGTGAFPWVTGATEDPTGVDADVTVNDLCAKGAEVFAAMNTSTASVRMRNAAGTWSRYRPDGATDLSVGTATIIKCVVRNTRFVIVGGTDARSIYEVVNVSTPSAMETLPEGWRFTAVWEAGGFIYASAICAQSNQCRIHHYGLNAAATALEPKGASVMALNHMIQAGEAATSDLIIMVGGKRNKDGGYDPVVWSARPDAEGFLVMAKLYEEKGSGATDLSVTAIANIGEAMLWGWSLKSGASTQAAREGLGIYHLGLGAFAHHLAKVTTAATPNRIRSITVYKGRVLFSVQGDGLYYEDIGTYVAQAEMVPSIADWNSAGRKAWNQVQGKWKPLAADTSVTLDYTVKHPEEADWRTGGTFDTDGSENGEVTLANEKSVTFDVRIRSNANAAGTAAPTVLGFSVRSDPSPAQSEWRLNRFVRIAAKDKKSRKGEWVLQNPGAIRQALHEMAHSWTTLTEDGVTWTAWVSYMGDFEPIQPVVREADGQVLDHVYVVRIGLIATRN